MTVIPFEEKYRKDFIEMNRAWIASMFRIEPQDEAEFADIDPYLAHGGQIFFAIDDAGHAMATCMIAPREDGDWEIMKFAARGMYTGTGAGSACLHACIDPLHICSKPDPIAEMLIQQFLCSLREFQRGIILQ